MQKTENFKFRKVKKYFPNNPSIKQAKSAKGLTVDGQFDVALDAAADAVESNANVSSSIGSMQLHNLQVSVG